MAEIEVRLPKMGESVTEATITNWLKNIGDKVAIDEPLVEVATDKVDSEVPSLVSGIVTELLFKQNDVISIGETIAIIKTDGVVLPTEKKEDHKKKSLKEYNNIMFGIKENDLSYRLNTIVGIFPYKKNIEDCYPKKKDIDYDLSLSLELPSSMLSID